MKALFLFFSFSSLAFSQMKMVEVGAAQRAIDGVSFEAVKCGKADADQKLSELLNVMTNDFAFYSHLFTVISQENGKNSDPDEIYRKQLLSNKVFYLVTLTCRSSSKALIKLFDLRTSEKKFERDFNLDDSSSRAAIHAVSDQVYEKITGKKSFFLSRIVFISDYGSNPPRKIVKELYVMDFDGFNSQRLTSHGGIVISPAVSYDNKKVLYSLIENGTKNKNINLYEIDIASKKSRTLSSRAGINSGAIYTPDGRSIILTLSHEGNAEIYQMDLASGSLRNITKHSAEDVDPSINRDGSLLTFLSSRAGRAMIYTLDPRGLEKDVKRVSFVGQFNASPRFAPDGSEIVFASWVDNGFDLYRLSADSQSLVRLSKDFGSNEEPTYSPDGEFIVFTSRRVLNRKTAEQKLYIMNREGQILGPLTQNIGQCFSPKFFN